MCKLYSATVPIRFIDFGNNILRRNVVYGEKLFEFCIRTQRVFGENSLCFLKKSVSFLAEWLWKRGFNELSLDRHGSAR